jgi:hypothetical protein
MQVLVGISKGRRPTGEFGRRWEDNIKRIFRMLDVGHILD